MSLQPYAVIFPDTEEPILALELDRKADAVPKGTYGFIEFYCIDPECDCRRVTLFVLNEKMKEKAVISMGFDPRELMAGPFLDDFHKQSPYADLLLDFFVDLINDDPAVLEMLHRHYREVREKVTGKKYRGKAFPKAGRFIREATPAPDMVEAIMDSMTATGGGEGNYVSAPGKGKKKAGVAESATGMRLFAERYHEAGHRATHGEWNALQDELRRYVLDHDDVFAAGIADLLVELCSTTPNDDGMIDAALRVLSDTLEILRVELERKRPGSRERMEHLQNTLGQKIFVEYGDVNLCAAVSHVLLQSRVEVLPVIHDATSQRMLLNAHSTGLHDMPEEPVMDDLFNDIEEMGGNSPFEALEHLLQILALGPAEVQIALCGEMLEAKSLLVRDTALLMILHPMPEVRAGVTEILAAHGRSITPDALRRLIISRNWFPEAIRKNIDKAITSARKGRVECASLPKKPDATVYASPVDGAFAQSFQVVIPDGKGFQSCAVLLKKGAGVADAFVVPLPTKRDRNEFLSAMSSEGAFIESSMEYLDLRVCHGLAEGAELYKAPNHWLLQVAEMLGRDQWKAVPFDAQRELEQMRATLASCSPEQLADKVRKKALQESGDWYEDQHFTSSWFEDDADVDLVIENVLKKKRKKVDVEWQAVQAVVENILEKRRSIWLDRLTLCALWLKSSRKAPLPWQQMFHLAEAVADPKMPLTEIPLMESVAVRSLGAYLARLEDENEIF
jgi:hypothetical protein